VNPLHTLPANLPKIHFYPILPFMAWSFKWSFSFWLCHKQLVQFFSSPMHATYPTHLILLDLIFGNEYKLWSPPMAFIYYYIYISKGPLVQNLKVLITEGIRDMVHYCPTHPPWFNLPNNIWQRQQIINFLIMQSSSLPLTLFLVGLTILLSIPFLNMLYPSSSLRVTDYNYYCYC
jgi:hypothetical protein